MPEYLIEPILPSMEVHLLGGISDAGKTRWNFHWLKQWEQGLPILGYKSNPVPWMYVGADRTERTYARTAKTMGLNLQQDIPFLPAFGREHKDMHPIIEAAAAARVELLIIEAFQKFVDPPRHEFQVTSFLERMSSYTDPSREFPNGLTILGVVESPKMKPHERYAEPRQRVSGVSAWGYYSGTVFLIERDDPTDSIHRTLHVCPKQGTQFAIQGGFTQNGHLVFP